MLRHSSLVVMLPVLLFATPARSAPLANPGFEATEPAAGWTRHIYGAEPSIDLSPEAHEGRQSLQISSHEPTDSALGQEVTLPPGGWYRFTGWVKTRGLETVGAPVYGTFQIQTPGGRSTIATA